jgi:hypothetical protein
MPGTPFAEEAQLSPSSAVPPRRKSKNRATGSYPLTCYISNSTTRLVLGLQRLWPTPSCLRLGGSPVVLPTDVPPRREDSRLGLKIDVGRPVVDLVVNPTGSLEGRLVDRLFSGGMKPMYHRPPLLKKWRGGLCLFPPSRLQYSARHMLYACVCSRRLLRIVQN